MAGPEECRCRTGLCVRLAATKRIVIRRYCTILLNLKEWLYPLEESQSFEKRNEKISNLI